MNWWNAWMGWVRRLPVAQWLRPFWKVALKAAVKIALDEAREETQEAFIKHGPRAIDRNIDAIQAKLDRGLAKLEFLPDGVEQKIKAIIQEKGDDLQSRLKESVVAGGPSAINAAFDKFKDELLARIDGL